MNAHMIGWAVVFTGVAVVSLSALAAAAIPRAFDRLHLLTVTTSVGAPLTGLGLVIVRGFSEASAMIVAITVAVVLSAPVVSAATARIMAGHDGLLGEEPPS